MPKVFYLDVKFNDVEEVDEDSLWGLPNLQYFIINNNKLKTLQKQTFIKNQKLKEVKANNNELKILHRDLFKNNFLLEKINFSDNKLKEISTDLRLLKLSFVDLHRNICINKSLNEVNSISDFQDLLNANCSKINNERNEDWEIIPM